MDVPTIVGGVALELPVVMRSSVAVTVIMRQRTILALTISSDMISLATQLRRSYVHFVILNRRFNKFAKIVVYAWEDTSVEFASSLMMIHLKSSTIVMDAASAGLAAPRISFTVTSVAAAILLF